MSIESTLHKIQDTLGTSSCPACSTRMHNPYSPSRPIVHYKAHVRVQTYCTPAKLQNSTTNKQEPTKNENTHTTHPDNHPHPTRDPAPHNKRTSTRTAHTKANNDNNQHERRPSTDRRREPKTWNPHTCGFTQATQAEATFADHTCTLSINKTTTEPGHIAAGAWWTTSFKTHQKLPLLNTHVQATFQACLTQATYQPPNEWLRIALATATQRADGTVVYTELDIYDTSNTQNHPTGNTNTGGNTIYTGADVVEYKTDQIPTNQWKNYTLDITSHVNQAWTIRQGDKLESVYIVIETANTPTQVTLQIRNLWITQTS